MTDKTRAKNLTFYERKDQVETGLRCYAGAAARGRGGAAGRAARRGRPHPAADCARLVVAGAATSSRSKSSPTPTTAAGSRW